MTPEQMQEEMDRLQKMGAFSGSGRPMQNAVDQSQAGIAGMNSQMAAMQQGGAFKGAEPPGLLSRLGTGINNFRNDPEKMARLTMGLNSMRLNPSQGISAAAQQTIQTAQEDRRLDSRANATIKALQAQAASDPLAKVALEAIQANPSAYLEIFSAYAKEKIKGKDAVTQMSGIRLNAMPGGGAYDPKAMYNVTTGPDGQKVSKIGGGGTTVINSGPPTLPPGLKKLDEAYATDHLAWTRGGGADMAANVAQVNTVLQKLEAGEQLTGPMIGAVNNVGLLGLVNPEAENAKEMIQEVVQRNLRVILGAQFAQKEGEQLISRAYNPTLPAAANARRLRKLYQQMEVSRQQRDAMATYFNEKYTLRGYTGPQPKIGDFYTALSQFDVGQEVNGYKYMGGDSNVESNWEKVK